MGGESAGVSSHCLIEDYETFKFALKEQKKSPSACIWYTTSPWLLEKFSQENIPSVSLEEGVDLDDIRTWGELTVTILRGIKRHVNERIKKEGLCSLELGDAMGSGYYRLFSTLLYKAHLLDRWLNKIAKEPQPCFIYGDPRLTLDPTFFIPVHRFDNFYAALAAHAGLPVWVKVITAPKPVEQDRLKMMTEMPRWDRFFSLFQLDTSVLLSRVWGKYLRYSSLRWPFKKESMRLWILRETPFLREMFLPLLLEGVRFERLPGISALDLGVVGNDGHEQFFCDLQEELAEIIRQQISQAAARDSRNALIFPFSDSLARLFASQITPAVRYGCCLAPFLEKQLDGLLQAKSGYSQIKGVLSLCFKSNLEERLLGQLLARRAIPFIEFEHGISYGISGAHLGIGDFLTMSASSALVTYTENSLNFFQKELMDQGKPALALNAPKMDQQVTFKRLQRFAGRRWLEVPSQKRLIIYVTNVYHNNMVAMPHMTQDYLYHQAKKNIITKVFPKLNDYFLVKLYPSLRYRDPDPFAELIPLAGNVKIVQFSDFLHWRALADTVILDYPYSTVGTSWISGVPLIYLDFPWNPLLDHTAEAFDKAIFRINGGQENWLGELERILLLPHKELLRLWNNKQGARRQATEYFITGSHVKSARQKARDILNLVDEAGRSLQPEPIS